MPTNQALKVRDVIEMLKSYDQDMPVALSLYSEYVLFSPRNVSIVRACEPRSDGWVQRRRPDLLETTYLVLNE